MSLQGHMARAVRKLAANIRAVDVVFELVDARAPLTTMNSRMKEHIVSKPSVLVLTKADLGGEDSNRAWKEYWKRQGRVVYLWSAEQGSTDELLDLARTTVTRSGRRMSGSLRCMVVGVPNVGKSTLINRIAGGKKARTGARAGITRGEQWVQRGDVRLLDLPGILPPDIDGEEALAKLTILACVPTDLMSEEDAALHLIRLLVERSPRTLELMYENVDERLPTLDILEAIGRARGCLRRGNEVDWPRAGTALLKDYRLGKLGRISLEDPPHEIECDEHV